MGIQEYLDDRSTHRRFRSQATGRLRSEGFYRASGTILSSHDAWAASGWGQETTSLYNQAWNILIHQRHSRDVGGPFYSRKVSLYTSVPNMTLASNADLARPTLYYFRGVVFPDLPVSRLAQAIDTGKMRTVDIWTSENAVPRSDLRLLGGQLMVRANPTSPAFRSADVLGEALADMSILGIPLKDFVRTGVADVPGEYLNLQFAILPTISDGQKFIEASKEAEQIIAQYRRDAGKLIRRRRDLPRTVDHTNTTTASGLVHAGGGAVVAFLQRNGSLNVKRTTVRDVWFEGAYRYFLPLNTDGWYRTLKEWNRVYGFIPNPKSLWEAVPFSWLIDYFTNTQVFIQGMFMAGTEGSALVRGYVMCTTHVKTEYTWTGEVCVAGSWKRVVLSWKTDEVIKQRERARPYGIGFTGQSLTAKQLSILAAFGISRYT